MTLSGSWVANRRFLLKPLQNIDLTYHRVFTHKGVSILRNGISLYITHGRTVGEGNRRVERGLGATQDTSVLKCQQVGCDQTWLRRKTILRGNRKHLHQP